MQPTVSTVVSERLRQARQVAVVGLSSDPQRPSYQVAAYLLAQGYQIVPVNPTVAEVLGQPSYPSLAAIPAALSIDIVDVFRQPASVPALLEELAETRRRPLVWLQEGVGSAAAATRAQELGLELVMDRCIMKVHRALTAETPWS